jgi:hypothetical protein
MKHKKNREVIRKDVIREEREEKFRERQLLDVQEKDLNVESRKHGKIPGGKKEENEQPTKPSFPRKSHW